MIDRRALLGSLGLLAAKAQPAGKVLINLKTAKALGLTIPAAPLQRADQVIE